MHAFKKRYTNKTQKEQKKEEKNYFCIQFLFSMP